MSAMSRALLAVTVVAAGARPSSAASVAAHAGCNERVMAGGGCAPGLDASGIARCLECVASHAAEFANQGCTPVMTETACRGVTPRVAPPAPKTEGMLKLNLLTAAAQKDGAVCLDGSPGGYYFRKGVGEDASKFLVILQGGSWGLSRDAGATTEGTLIAYSNLASGPLGSSKLWVKQIEPLPHGLTTPNCTANPAFCKWSVAYIYYCDGTSYSGDRADPVVVHQGLVSPIYFRGKKLLEANIQDILKTQQMSKATDVVLAGHDSGATAAYIQADAIREMLPSTITSYRAIPDAGFFMDVKDFSGNYSFGDKLRAAFKVANASGSLNEACKADHVDPYDCVFPQRFAQHIKTPLFPVQSLYDDYQVMRVLKLGCTPSDPTPPGACSPAQMEAFFQFGLALRAAANATGLFTGRNNGGAFMDSCMAHSQGFYGYFLDNPRFEVPMNSGNTLSKTMNAWVTGEQMGKEAVHVDTVPWPQNRPCSFNG